MSSLRTSRRKIIQAMPLLAATLVGRGAAARDSIRVGMIPDAGSTQVSVEQKAPLRDYLAKAMNQPVELIIPTNYNATVEALGNDSLDFAYVGGPTYIKAHARYGVVPIVQRDSDRDAGAVALGLHSAGVLGKLYAESCENVRRPAVRALEATGASPLAVACYAILPLASAPMAVHTLFRLEWNLRAATVVGMIGAGGIGQALYDAQQLLFYRQMMAYVLITRAMVMLSDAWSDGMRGRMGWSAVMA
jgi:hypothetical protein